MIQHADTFFNSTQICDTDDNQLCADGLINFILSSTKSNEKNSSLIVVKTRQNEIDFIGRVAEIDKFPIKNALKLKEFYPINFGFYRMVLNKSIYLFKKFDSDFSTVLMGVLLEKTDDNRLKVMDKQSEHLLRKTLNW